MSKRIGLAIAAVAIAGAAVAGLTARKAAAQQAASTSLPTCTLPDKHRYSPGAQIKYENETYRCLFVWGEEMKPGVAWVRMEMTWNAKQADAGR